MFEIIAFTLGLLFVVALYVIAMLVVMSDFTDEEVDEVFKNLNNFDNNIFQ